MAVLAMGAAFALLAGGWIVVGQLLKPTAQSIVSFAPQESFSPVYPSVPLSTPNIDKECGDFFDQEDAQKYYIAQGGPKEDPDKLDLDKDGSACENYNYSTITLSPSKETQINDK